MKIAVAEREVRKDEQRHRHDPAARDTAEAAGVARHRNHPDQQARFERQRRQYEYQQRHGIHSPTARPLREHERGEPVHRDEEEVIHRIRLAQHSGEGMHSGEDGQREGKRGNISPRPHAHDENEQQYKQRRAERVVAAEYDAIAAARPVSDFDEQLGLHLSQRTKIHRGREQAVDKRGTHRGHRVHPLDNLQGIRDLDRNAIHAPGKRERHERREHPRGDDGTASVRGCMDGSVRNGDARVFHAHADRHGRAPFRNSPKIGTGASRRLPQTVHSVRPRAFMVTVQRCPCDGGTYDGSWISVLAALIRTLYTNAPGMRPDFSFGHSSAS